MQAADEDVQAIKEYCKAHPNKFDLEAVRAADVTGSFYPNGVSLPGKEQYAAAYSSEFDTALLNGAHKRQAEGQAAASASQVRTW